MQKYSDAKIDYTSVFQYVQTYINLISRNKLTQNQILISHKQTSTKHSV